MFLEATVQYIVLSLMLSLSEIKVRFIAFLFKTFKSHVLHEEHHALSDDISTVEECV